MALRDGTRGSEIGPQGWDTGLRDGTQTPGMLMAGSIHITGQAQCSEMLMARSIHSIGWVLRGTPAYLPLFGEDLLAVEPALLPHGTERDVREVGG